MWDRENKIDFLSWCFVPSCTCFYLLFAIFKLAVLFWTKSKYFENLVPSICTSQKQILANRGPDSTFVDEGNRVRSSPKPRQSRVINLMDRTRVTGPRGKYRVIFGHFRVIIQVFIRVI